MISDEIVYVCLIKWEKHHHKKALFWSILSSCEKKKVNQMVFQGDQHHFLITRGLLRILIAKIMSCAPEKLVFNYNPFGKPELLGKELEFNLSHSKEYAVYTFCRYKKLGIDIEYQKHKLPFQRLAKRYFSDNENKVLCGLNYFDKRSAFFNGWVQKEAVVKAFGYGRNWPLANVPVSMQFLDITHTTYQAVGSDYLEKVLLYPIKTPAQFKGALAIITDQKSTEIKELGEECLGFV